MIGEMSTNDVTDIRDKGKQPMFKPKTPTESDNLPWVEKYRPSSLEDLIAHDDIISTITTFINEGKLPHLLFYGPPGVYYSDCRQERHRRFLLVQKSYMVLDINQ
jgi:replication factor C subunit 3/5